MVDMFSVFDFHISQYYCHYIIEYCVSWAGFDLIQYN